MRDKWVDTHGYFGPDRRRRPGKKPWKDRRTLDETTKPPPLGQLLRRLRVQMMGFFSPDDRRHILQILSAAILEAERVHCFETADALKQADRALRMGTPSDKHLADGLIGQAIDLSAAGR